MLRGRNKDDTKIKLDPTQINNEIEQFKFRSVQNRK
jgi:hypothetical protein